MWDYLALPGLIGEQFIKQMSRYPKEGIEKIGFTNSMRIVFRGVLEERIQLIFNMYDFDNDGYITKEDVRILLSYAPLDNLTLESLKKSVCEKSLLKLK